MSSNRTLMVLPGDGVGPEVVKETLRVDNDAEEYYKKH